MQCHPIQTLPFTLLAYYNLHLFSLCKKNHKSKKAKPSDKPAHTHTCTTITTSLSTTIPQALTCKQSTVPHSCVWFSPCALYTREQPRSTVPRALCASDGYPSTCRHSNHAVCFVDDSPGLYRQTPVLIKQKFQ